MQGPLERRGLPPRVLLDKAALVAPLNIPCLVSNGELGPLQLFLGFAMPRPRIKRKEILFGTYERDFLAHRVHHPRDVQVLGILDRWTLQPIVKQLIGRNLVSSVVVCNGITVEPPPELDGLRLVGRCRARRIPVCEGPGVVHRVLITSSSCLRSRSLQVYAVTLWERTGLTRPWNNPLDNLRRAVEGSTSTVLARVIDGNLTATAMVGHDGHRGWVYYVAVDPEHQSSGVGREMMDASEEWLRAQGTVKVQLMVRESNQPVVEFYEGLDYENSQVVVLAKWLR